MKIGNLSSWATCMVSGTILTGSVASAGDVYITGGTTTVIQQQQAEPIVTSVDDFRKPLSRYGTWMEVEDYGSVWQPQVVAEDSSWRPYCHGGSWVWSERGWSWQSSYAWGWAPFHYGRWACTRRYGWVWMPDVIWGPAWVEWRSTETHVGWAPMYPAPRNWVSVGFASDGNGFSFSFGISDEDRYCFVPHRRFWEPEVVPYVVPRRETTVIYNRSARTVYDRHDERERDTYDRTERVEVPRDVSVQAGRRTQQLQERFGSVRPAPAEPARPVVNTRVQSSRAEVIREQMTRSNRSEPSRVERVQSSPLFPATNKPLRQTMEERHISSERVNPAVARTKSPEPRRRVSDEIRRRLADGR